MKGNRINAAANLPDYRTPEALRAQARGAQEATAQAKLDAFLEELARTPLGVDWLTSRDPLAIEFRFFSFALINWPYPMVPWQILEPMYPEVLARARLARGV